VVASGIIYLSFSVPTSTLPHPCRLASQASAAAVYNPRSLTTAHRSICAMFATLFQVTLFCVVALQGVLADFTIYTPQFTQCEPANITWTQSQGPYDLIITPAEDPCGDAIVDFGEINGLSTSYTVNIAAGTQVVLSLQDSEGEEAWSGTITVNGSDNTSCLNSTSPTVSTGGTTMSAGAPSGTPFAPAGAANAGTNPSSSGAMSTRPLGALSAVGAVAVAAAAFVL